MTSANLAQALRASASGIYTAEAAAGMLIAHATWLDRDDFRQFIHTDPGTGMAAIDWPAATSALTAGLIPSSNGEQKMLHRGLHLSGPDEQGSRDAVVVAVSRAKILWLVRSDGYPLMLHMSASIAGHAPVILGDTITGLDDRNIQILVSAILHASGRRQLPPVR
jgi:hypothetical protein